MRQCRRRWFGPLRLLLLYGKEPSGALLAWESLLQVMALCPCHPESFMAGEGKEKLRVSSWGQLLVLAPTEDGRAGDCFHWSPPAPVT